MFAYHGCCPSSPALQATALATIGKFVIKKKASGLGGCICVSQTLYLCQLSGVTLSPISNVLRMCVFLSQVGEKEAIFGSVTAAEIVDAIRMQVGLLGSRFGLRRIADWLQGLDARG